MLRLDISKYFTKPRQYKIAIQGAGNDDLKVIHFEPLYNSNTMLKELYSTIEKGRLYLINRTAQIVDSTKVELKVQLKLKEDKKV